MSLKQRSEYLWNTHSIHIIPQSLHLLYKRYGIQFSKARAMKKDLLFEKEQYFKERAEAAYDIASLFANNVPYVFVDETTLYVNNLKAKTW